MNAAAWASGVCDRSCFALLFWMLGCASEGPNRSGLWVGLSLEPEHTLELRWSKVASAGELRDRPGGLFGLGAAKQKEQKN